MLRSGVQIVDGHLPPAVCRDLVTAIRAERDSGGAPWIERRLSGRSLRYQVLDGERIHRGLPGIEALVPAILRLARAFARRPLELIPNRTAAVNVNITRPGGEYRWHYDRNSVTAILYLNRVMGGETEMYPEYRLHLGRWRASRAQARLDALLRWAPIRRVFGELRRVAPDEGRLLIMRGDRCLHSVCPVDEGERINVILSFDAPGATFAQQDDLDPYLYERTETPSFDPNYIRR